MLTEDRSPAASLPRPGAAFDWWLAALLFAVAAVVGSTYVRAFDRTGVRTPADVHTLSDRSMWFGQSEFGAAVALACGRGFVDPERTLTPGLAAFLTVKADRFSCDELPAVLPARQPNVTQRLYRYLMWTTAGVWAIRGVSWSALWPIYGLLYGATVAVCYGLFRFGMGRLLSAAAALAITISAVHLGNLPGLRDYAKAPFILGLMLIAAHLAAQADRPRAFLALAALFGGVLGIGFGFRNDILIVVPLLVAVVLAWKPPRDRRAIGVRLAALGLAALVFAIAASPILLAYARGSNSGHVALMGLMPGFERPLGVRPSVYEWGYAFSDEFAETLINSYTSRVAGHPVTYLSSEYDRAMVGYLSQIARHWPADILTRACAAVLQILNLPFTVGVWAAPIPYGIQSASALRLYGWQIGALNALEGTGAAAVALALLIVSASSVHAAVFLLVVLLFFCGYPAIQFMPRHFFQLEFVGWWAIGFVVERAVAGAWRAWEARRAGVQRPTMSWEAVRRVATFAAIAIGIVAVPLAAARLYQQRHVGTMLTTYAEAARDPLRLQPADAGGRTLLQTSALWDDSPSVPVVDGPAAAAPKIRTQYVVATFWSRTCPAVRLPVTFRYHAAEKRLDFSHDVTLTFAPADAPVEIFFPAYDVVGSTRFEGVEVPRGFERCVVGAARIRDLQPTPMLLNLTLTFDWQQAPLYQTLRWEPSGPPPPLAVYAVPPKLPVARATLGEALRPPPVLWRTAIVQGDPSGRWSLTGTPRGPRWPALQFADEARAPDDRFVLEGEVRRGGITVGLVRGDAWIDGSNVTIATPGRFAAVLAPPATGAFGVLFENSLDDSWFLGHAPSWLAQAAGRLHVFNDVLITRAGWVQAR